MGFQMSQVKVFLQKRLFSPEGLLLILHMHLTSHDCLKDKLRDINIFEEFCEQTSILIRQCQIESGQERSRNRSQGQGFYREDAEVKQSNYLIGYSLISCLGKAQLAVYDGLFLSFTFSDLSPLILAQVLVCLLRLPRRQTLPHLMASCLNTLTRLYTHSSIILWVWSCGKNNFTGGFKLVLFSGVCLRPLKLLVQNDAF